MKRIMGTTSDRKKKMLSLFAILMGCILLITSVTQESFASPNTPEILSFERANPVYEVSVNTGTALDQMGLPESLRAVLPFSAEAEGEEPVDEKVFVQTVPYEYAPYDYIAPGNEAELREAGELVIYTIHYGDGGKAYRVHGTYDGENESFYACDEDGQIFGMILDVPVTWYGVYDADTPGSYTFTARINDYAYSGEMPGAVLTVHQMARGPMRSPPQSVTITTDKGLLAALGKLTVDKSTGFIKNEDWVVVKTQGNGADKALMLARKGGGNLGRFGSSNAYAGSELQQFYTGYYTGWESPLKDLALVPTLGAHTNDTSVSNPKFPLELASKTTQTIDIVFAMSRQDMVAWNNNKTTPVRDLVRNNWPRTDQSSHMWLRTKGTGTSFVWELNNTGKDGYIADAAQSTGNINRVPTVWVKVADVWRNVSIHYIDTNGNAFRPPDLNAYQVLYDEGITLNDTPAFTGYQFTKTWKVGSTGAVNKTLPVTVSNIRKDTDIYLIYEKTTTDITVTVRYIDKANGNPIGSPTMKTYLVPLNNNFTLPEQDIQDIPGYEHKEWKVGSAGAVNTALPITVANVASDTDIYLLYEKKVVVVKNTKNAYINGIPVAQNGTADVPVMVALEDKIKYTITTDNQTKPGASGAPGAPDAKYDILFVLDWSESMDSTIYGTESAKQYERRVTLDMFDFITNKYPDSRVAVTAMNSKAGFHGNLANTYLQYDTAFMTPSEYMNGGRAAMETAFTEPWKNPAKDPSTFLNVAVNKMKVTPISLGKDVGGEKQTIPRTAPAGEDLADRIPVIVLISDFQIPKDQTLYGLNYWTSIMNPQSNNFNTAYPAGILQTVRFDHLGNHTGPNPVYSANDFDVLMKNNVSPNGHNHWGFTKVDMGTPYTDALSTIKNDFMALAPPPSSGQGTVITDEVPEGLDVDTDSISHDGVYDPDTRTITWDLWDQNVGEITVWFTATVEQRPKTFENTAEIIFIDGNKANTNPTYHKAGQDIDVTITKTVDGAFGNRTQAFNFYVYLYSFDPTKPLESGKTFSVESGIIPGSGADAPTYTTLTLIDDIYLTFSLKHGQTLTIEDLPSHLMIAIVEESDEKYDPSFTDSKDGSTGDGIVGLRAVDTDDGTRTFAFVNERIMAPPTGITSGGTMEAVLLLIAAPLILAGVIGFRVMKKRLWSK